MKAGQKTLVLGILFLIYSIVGGVIVDSVRSEITTSNKSTIKKTELSSVYAKKEPEIEEEIVEEVVYEGMTLTDLTEKLNRSLKHELKGKGDIIASYSLKKGVDPYIATAIILHETGCAWNKCSNLVAKCNNVGGIKGSGCGNYRSYDTLDDGIKGLINNLERNYFSKGLTTPEQINGRYATSKTWKDKVNNHIKRIKTA